jgi:hypothetical protein
LSATCSESECERDARARGLCHKHYTRASRLKRLNDYATLPPLPETCAVEGCGRERVAQARGRYRYCAAHRGRHARRGDVSAHVPVTEHIPGPWPTTGGYLEMSALNHPLAGTNGHARAHRVILYDAIGPGAHPCHWCGQEVRWEIDFPLPGTLTVDHLDFDKTNNDLSNLAPSCHPCNASRTRKRAS